MKTHNPPILDEHWEGYELAADDAYRYVWVWQGFNIRLLAVPKNEDGAMGYDFGWCYPRDPQLVADSVAAWDSDTQDEPMGWHKRPTGRARRAPRRDADPQYNRDRCEHGHYVDEGCRTVNCRDVLAHQRSRVPVAHHAQQPPAGPTDSSRTVES
ncbi:hypothetical protein EES44_24600 [Streptomyces sp. ADI96-15]|uniref:hypothetical protein n=1 Tax=Streptomyces sp. ADI96-15 TaxID=1522761 RepID=UPI000F54DB52|nr:MULTISPECIES: hypothetical protein [unclassified Streptomyces]MDH6189188.1 hypothetical protein [Streptomyces sp. CZ24]RPK58116.1 hypothetical protein EES44_24600 [Streptomyces sp. ADI96-15]